LGFCDLFPDRRNPQLFFSDLNFHVERLQCLFLFRCHSLLLLLSNHRFHRPSQAKALVGNVFSRKHRQIRSMSSVNFYPRRQGPHLDTAGAIRHPTPTRVGVTTMLQEEGPIENLDVRESSSVSLPKLADLARQAYGQKRAKDCLDLTRAILLIDPENVEAQLMRSAIRAEITQSLQASQALLRSAQLKQSPEAPQSSVDIAQETDQDANE